MAAIDRNILVSLHGRRFGFNKNGDLILDGRVARMNPGNPAGQVVMFDDFLGDAVASNWNFQEGSDSATSDAAIVAGTVNGALGITTGDSTGTMAVSGAQFEGTLTWKASKGGLAMEVLIQFDVITTSHWFIGFTDQVAALEMPWGLSGTTYTSTATDSAGFLFDTAATTDTIRCVGVATDVDATAVDTSNPTVAATDIRLRIEINTAGVGTYYIDGVQVARITGVVTTTVKLVPVIAIFSSSGSSSVVATVDYIYVQQDR